MSDYEDDAYADESFEESSPQKKPTDAKSPISSRGSSPAASRGIASRDGGAPKQAVAAPPPPPRIPPSSTSTPRDDANLSWLKPTPKTPPRDLISAPSGERDSKHSTPVSSPAKRSAVSSSRSSSPQSSRSRSRSSSRYSSPASSPMRSPEKSHRDKTGVPPLAPAQQKPTSAPFQSQRNEAPSDSDSDGRHSDSEAILATKATSQPNSGSASHGKKTAPGAAKAPPLLTRVAVPTTIQDMNLLRLKNAELQRAVDEVRQQLARLAPRMSVLKVKRRTDEERLKKLQQEAAQLAADYQTLSKKCRDANHVKSLEKQIKEREEEIKRLTERNRFLQVEIRQNTKRLRRDENIDEQRKNLLEGLRNERVIAQMNLDRAKKDAETAVKNREALAQRVQELEVKDKLRDLSMEEVKRIIELRQLIAQREESIANLDHRLSVLRRAADSTALSSKPSGLGSAASVPAPSGGADQMSIMALKEEIASMKQKLELYSAQRVDEQTAANVKKRQEAAALPSAKVTAGAPAPTAVKSKESGKGATGTKKRDGALPDTAASAVSLATKPAPEAWEANVPTKGGPAPVKASKTAPAVAAAKAARPISAEHTNPTASSTALRAESVPPIPTSASSASGHYEDDDFEETVASPPASITKAASAVTPAAPVVSASADVAEKDDSPPWMVDEDAQPPAANGAPSESVTRESAALATASSNDLAHADGDEGKPSWLAEEVESPAKHVGAETPPAAVTTTIGTPVRQTPEQPPHVVAAPPADVAPQAKASDEPAWLFDE